MQHRGAVPALDTNAVIAVLNERVRSVAERFDVEIARRTKILISTIVLYELRDRIAKSVRPQRNRAVLAGFLELPVSIIGFDADDAAEAGELRATLANLLKARSHRLNPWAPLQFLAALPMPGNGQILGCRP
jgi:predicted nucleic acid-binding protein